MPLHGWNTHVEELAVELKALACTRKGRPVAPDAAFAAWRDLALAIRKNRKTIFLIGNGASASMASHLAADLAKNARLRTEVFSDLSLLTAISNDMGYEHVFAEPLSRRASKGDMLVAISSSGFSSNVLAAAKVAKRLGLTLVSLSAMKTVNPLRAAGTLSFYVPADTYGAAESCHAAILHHWMDLVAESVGRK